MKQFCMIWLCVFSLVMPGKAQQLPAPAQLAAIQQLPDDTAKVNRLNNLASSLFASDPMFAINVLKEATRLSEKIKYPLGGSVAYGIHASMLIYEMKLDSALLLLDKSFELVKNRQQKEYINQQASLHQKYGALLQQQQLYDTAIKKYLLAAELYKQTGNENLSIVGFYNIAVMYGFLDQPEKALFYARQVNRIAQHTKDPEFLVRSYIALGDAFVATRQFDSVYFYAQKGLATTAGANNPFVAGKFQQLTGIYFLKGKANYNAALISFDSALTCFEKINLPYEKALVYRNMANVYLQKKDYANAIKFGSTSVELCKPLKMYELQSQAVSDLALAAEYSGQVNEAYKYLREYVALRDTLEQLNKKKLVNELETRYQSQKKEALLQAQQNTIYRKNVWNYILIGGAVTILALSLLGYFNYRQKQKLQQQRISELETSQKLMATEAVLKGEEQERTRLAKDLHDGLGGMLSGIKYSFNAMKGNMVMTPENTTAFERSMDMLDSSIKEMRRVAHNMMPETLVKFGLDAALKDFCNDINQSGALRVSYQSIGMQDAVIDQTVSITVYRIIQELINNTMKHAGAINAIVQLTQAAGRLTVTVEDDGRGFDTAILQQPAGMGWNNIQNRVEFLKGAMDVRSEKNKGTSVHIELDLS